MDAVQLKTYGFVLAAALGYALATVGMKLAAGSASHAGNWTLLALALLLLGFFAATHSEMTLMREVHLGALYLLIIAVETLVVLVYAWIIGEGLGPRDMLGGGLVLAGALIIGH
ncbi:5-aminolevulinate synthase [Rhodalgimonas zhirmunskyi]|uniref:5-aminolevulinate synthase n=1 Tax=Rhodalgimonas zhirmunskyi TaxID=2964767 RepID=A0AAJ1UBG7_9RHOB|nr:5-aminolevulinate synthase [Rhodoalgimonas zhirmunskyi]MDQ2094593.1 5-aminolevulinate synthase [Rhodoalgimonas zhirmunskyi]